MYKRQEVISYHTIADDGTTNAIQIVALYPDNTHTVAYDSNGDGNLDRYEAKTANGTMLYAIGDNNTLTPISGTDIRDGMKYTYVDKNRDGIADSLTVTGTDADGEIIAEYHVVNGKMTLRRQIIINDDGTTVHYDSTCLLYTSPSPRD